MGIFGSGKRRRSRTGRSAPHRLSVPVSLTLSKLPPRPPLPALPPSAAKAIQRSSEVGLTFENSGFAEIGASLGWTRGQSYTVAHTYRVDAWSAQRLEQAIEKPIARVMPALQYLDVPDCDASPLHMQAHLLIAPSPSPIWRVLRPPLDWGCRCGYRLVSTFELERVQNEGYRREANFFLPPGMDMETMVDAVRAITGTWTDCSPWECPVPEFRP